MRVSVIIPAFNEERLIARTLHRVRSSLMAFSFHDWDTEVIVCDNNSTDRTAEIARQAGATVVFEPVNQIGRARNRGAEAASGNWLVFVDADSHPSADLFEEVAAQIESGRVLAGGCTVKLDGKHRLANFVTSLWNGISRTFRWMAGSFIFCEADAFKKVGGFSQELYASEEIDLSKRLKKLARNERKKIVILHRNPILTSDRKVHLYTLREHLRFLAKVVFRFGKPLTSREECHTWYDGRR